jgi:ABC-type branched-subunit amino acid transport system ATPase component
MTNAPSSLAVKDIHKSFYGIDVLRGVSFSVKQGSITALVGSNGAGKSTLLNVISGLFPANSGEVFLHGKRITDMPAYHRVRAGLFRTFQHPRVFASFTVKECIELAATDAREERLPRSLLGVFKRRRPASAPREASGALYKYQFQSKFLEQANARASDLSYGEQKLLMLSQVLAADGSVLCFDELCAGLEPPLVEQVRSCFQALAAEGRTIVFIEHNLALVRSLATNIIFLHQGQIFREGPADAVLQDPEVVRLYLGQ